ncbi:MAG: hypothetical protein Q8P87_00495 [bacterium]|nr:hypothetical protein [bacterium]
MNNLGRALVLMFIVLVGLWLWAVVDSKQTSPEVIQKELLTKQSSDQGEVSVEVTPVVLEPGREVKFNVVFSTHSVELDYDLLKVSSLSDDKDNSLTPISWSGGSGGHHLNGELVFSSIAGKAKSVELKIINISGFDRNFRWNIS